MNSVFICKRSSCVQGAVISEFLTFYLTFVPLQKLPNKFRKTYEEFETTLVRERANCSTTTLFVHLLQDNLHFFTFSWKTRRYRLPENNLRLIEPGTILYFRKEILINGLNKAKKRTKIIKH